MSKPHDYDTILTRLTRIIQRLQAGETLRVPQLAEEFGVSRKTIQRDLHERLTSYPLVSDGLGWKLMELEKPNRSEQLVIETLRQLAHNVGGIFANQADKLLNQLDKQSHHALSTHLHLQDPTPILDSLQVCEQAIEQRHELRFLHKQHWRRVQPYRLVNFDGYWYLYGLDSEKLRLKTWYLADITQITVTQLAFEMDNHAIQQLDYAMNVWFEPSSTPFIATLRADASIAHYFQRRPLSRTQQILTTHDGGGLTLQITATSEQEVLHEVKKWMPNLHIVAPAGLKKRSLQLAHIFMLHSSLQD